MLVKFDIKYVTTKSVKGRAIAKYLSNLAIKFEEEKDFVFPDKGVMKIIKDTWKMYFDGAVYQKGYGVGVILVALGGTHIPLAIKLRYTSTNNIVEYEACIIRMAAALNLGVEKIYIFGDSNLIIFQIRGE